MVSLHGNPTLPPAVVTGASIPCWEPHDLSPDSTMGNLLQDLRFGFRMLWKTPVVSSVAAVSLALGIAAATAMFALASAFWLQPLPFGDQDGLVLVREIRHGESLDMAAAASIPNFRDWEEGSTNLSSMAALNFGTANVTGVDSPEEIQIALGSPNLFERSPAKSTM